MEDKLTVDTIRAMKKQLESVTPLSEFRFPMRDDIRISVSGVVVVPGFGYLHPQAFIEVAGQETYDYLLALPRVVTEYD